ncbi:SIMPL domain-containing protein [Pontibacter litorisediminis]|uniref:SIMPL domain-containing protein n=1 Tax=Pontibacter litorisediminis TaxID=1846260 RepID=UPI0023EE18B8|nr:SIMPL domain-containing protein [Pontibacter litorisediminis]
MNKLYFLIIPAMLQCMMSFGQTKNFIDQPFIETAASVDTLVTPDEIYLSILINEKDTKGKISIEELESKMEARLQQLGVNTEESLSLNDLGSNFKKYFLKGQDVLKTKVYSLKVKDAQTAGLVILELEKIEISNIHLDRTEFSGIDQLKLALKSKAIAKAKMQAEYLVSPLNQKVGAALYISDQSDNAVHNDLQGRVAGIVVRGYGTASKSEPKPADIQFEKIKVESSVNVKFKLE